LHSECGAVEPVEFINARFVKTESMEGEIHIGPGEVGVQHHFQREFDSFREVNISGGFVGHDDPSRGIHYAFYVHYSDTIRTDYEVIHSLYSGAFKGSGGNPAGIGKVVPNAAWRKSDQDQIRELCFEAVDELEGIMRRFTDGCSLHVL
jgi:hypothetical protein